MAERTAGTGTARTRRGNTHEQIFVMTLLPNNRERRSSRSPRRSARAKAGGNEALISLRNQSEPRDLGCYERLAFTLVEMLVVISIIGILAGLILGVLPYVQEKKIRSRVKVEMEGVVTAIESYKAKRGFYPPDNLDLAWFPRFPPLYYELTGSDIPKTPDPAAVQAPILGITNIVNVHAAPGTPGSDEDEGRNFFQNVKQTQIFSTNGVYFLGVKTRSADGGDAALWNYDAHTSGRHNHETFDLWVDVKI